MRKPKPKQLTIFDQINHHIADSFADEIWAEFEPTVIALIKELGIKSCEAWWRSRYWETIICPKHARNKKGYEFEKVANSCWGEILNRILNKINHGKKERTKRD